MDAQRVNQVSVTIDALGGGGWGGGRPCRSR